MKAPLMKSVSGIRGIVGESLTPELIARIGCGLRRLRERRQGGGGKGFPAHG